MTAHHLHRLPANTSKAADGPQRMLVARLLSRMAKLLLVCGALGWFLFVTTFLIAGATRPGYNSRRRAICAHSLGPDGSSRQISSRSVRVCSSRRSVGAERSSRDQIHARIRGSRPSPGSA